MSYLPFFFLQPIPLKVGPNKSSPKVQSTVTILHVKHVVIYVLILSPKAICNFFTKTVLLATFRGIRQNIPQVVK